MIEDQPNTTAATSWHEVAPAQIPDDVHVVQHGDTLASIVERLGHPGEWKTLFHHNVPEESRDKIAPDALPVGVWLKLPREWLPERTERAGTGVGIRGGDESPPLLPISPLAAPTPAAAADDRPGESWVPGGAPPEAGSTWTGAPPPLEHDDVPPPPPTLRAP
jgi:hypothetical protein